MKVFLFLFIKHILYVCLMIIYGIKEISTDQFVYIGQTINLNRRIKEHFSNRCHNIKLLKKLSIHDNFKVEIIENCCNRIASIREKYFIERYLSEGHPIVNSKIGRPKKENNIIIKAVKVSTDKLFKLNNSGKLTYYSFSNYVRKLIDEDLNTKIC